ncbi:MAG: hypothetical protein Ct9H90mP13_12150 [Pseudomonadota bacterium]|nr:MAG: hypothetical protein Ct9H90mP13_12150 [Pseudomonadota bacterium]
MCIEKNEEDFITIHHELGHIFYYQAYANLPEIFQRVPMTDFMRL